MGETEKEMGIRKQLNNLGRLVKNNAFEFTDTFFPYTSGQIGPYFAQSAAILKNGRDYNQACLDMAMQIRNCDVISGGETRDWMFSFPVAAKCSVPHAMLYKNGKILGADMNGMKVAHVADLNNVGSSPRDYWVPIIKKAGGKITDIYFYVDRMEEGVEEMRKLGLNSHALVPLDETAWGYLLEENIISKEVYGELMQRMENKNEWARNMLRSEKGLARLAELFMDPKSTEKAKKILMAGYPDLKEELEDRLKSKYDLSRIIIC